jgi:hypothetical protein
MANKNTPIKESEVKLTDEEIKFLTRLKYLHLQITVGIGLNEDEYEEYNDIPQLSLLRNSFPF